DKPRCTGTLIRENVVLTSSACPVYVNVEAGEADAFFATGASAHPTATYPIVHVDRTATGLAIVHLDSPVRGLPHVAVPVLPTSALDGGRFAVAGFGPHFNYSTPGDDLRVGSMQLVAVNEPFFHTQFPSLDAFVSVYRPSGFDSRSYYDQLLTVAGGGAR